MPAEYLNSRLYNESLGHRPDDVYTDHRARLRGAHEQMRGQVSALANRIAVDLPGFTAHDVENHLDALWGLADLIAGPGVHFNAAEGFVFGAAVLLHDLGLAVAAYPGGRDELRATTRWGDIVALEMRGQLGRAPTVEERDHVPAEVARIADESVLRERHADQAVDLGTISWDADGERVYLLEDRDLRQAFGALAGKLAASHWWSISEVAELANDRAVAAFLPEWEVDVLKLAALLRLADAAHLDSRRSPVIRRALQGPRGYSKLHWDFHDHLGAPHRKGQELRFGSYSPFKVAEADAWWLCADALSTLDRELKGVASLFNELGRELFAVQGVVAANDPARLAKMVETDGWKPVDARVRVSDVPTMVERLGGLQLYGDAPLVPLREAIQNAADAVRARAALFPDVPMTGISVTVQQSADSSWLAIKVVDDGIGMSEETLIGELLDFGRSLWRSSAVVDRLPKLARSRFEPAGRFGIGFFSLFMYGRPVSVLSRFHHSGKTNVLEFRDGLRGRALLRRATEDEVRGTAGTAVAFEIPSEAFGLHGPAGADAVGALAERAIAALCPTLDVSLHLKTDDTSREILGGGDWTAVAAADLLERLGESGASVRQIERVRPIHAADGSVVGRLVLADSHGPGCHVTVGGVAAMRLDGGVGVIVGDRPNAARTTASIRATQAALAEWATEQAILWSDVALDARKAINLAGLVARFGGDVAGLAVCSVAEGPLCRERLVAWAQDRDHVVLWSEVDAEDLPSHSGWRPPFEPGPNTVVIDALVGESITSRAPEDPDHPVFAMTLEDIVLSAIAVAWGESADDLRARSSGTDLEHVGSNDAGDVFTSSALNLRRAVQ